MDASIESEIEALHAHTGVDSVICSRTNNATLKRISGKTVSVRMRDFERAERRSRCTPEK
jgi:hypothetical protein